MVLSSSLPSSVQILSSDDVYGASVWVLACMGARVAIVLRGNSLAAVAPMPGASSAKQGLNVIVKALVAFARMASPERVVSKQDSHAFSG